MEPTNINTTSLRLETRDLMERVKFKGERFIVATFGRPMAVIISFDDFQRVRHILGDEEKAVLPRLHANGQLVNGKKRRAKISRKHADA